MTAIRTVLYWFANRHLTHPIVQAHFLGKRLLAGITDMDESENTVGQRQMHGTIVRLNPHEGLVLRLSDGTEFQLPPDIRQIQKARRGQYRLRSTGEIVVDPDFTAVWVRIQHKR